MAEIETRRWLISGHVQGVFFRESTRREAEPRGIAGHAVNLTDGRVEVVARGSTDALAELERWLHDGPPMARVEHVESAAIEQHEIEPGRFRTG
jgi:acylphosphatase